VCHCRQGGSKKLIYFLKLFFIQINIFFKGEPNGEGKENCGEIRNGGWNDQSCVSKQPFICKVKHDQKLLANYYFIVIYYLGSLMKVVHTSSCITLYVIALFVSISSFVNCNNVK
jgi:hypothetical protein